MSKEEFAVEAKNGDIYRTGSTAPRSALCINLPCMGVPILNLLRLFGLGLGCCGFFCLIFARVVCFLDVCLFWLQKGVRNVVVVGLVAFFGVFVVVYFVACAFLVDFRSHPNRTRGNLLFLTFLSLLSFLRRAQKLCLGAPSKYTLLSVSVAPEVEGLLNNVVVAI